MIQFSVVLPTLHPVDVVSIEVVLLFFTLSIGMAPGLLFDEGCAGRCKLSVSASCNVSEHKDAQHDDANIFDEGGDEVDIGHGGSSLRELVVWVA